MTTGYISTSHAEEYLAQFVQMAMETPVGVFCTITGKQKARGYTEADPQFDDYERTFTAVQRGNGKYIYSFTDNPTSATAMGFHAQQLSVVAVVVDNTVYMVDACGFNIGVSCFLPEDFLQMIVRVSHTKVVPFVDYLKQVTGEITAALQRAYDQIPSDGILSDDDKKAIDENLRKYTISSDRQKNLEALTCYPFPTVETQTIAAILCGEENQDAVTAAMIDAERDAMVLHKAVRDYTLEQIKKAYEQPDLKLRIALGLDQAPAAKSVWVTFCVNDREATLKLPVWRLRSLLNGTNIYLSYWDFDNSKQAKNAMERLEVDDLFAKDIDKITFNGKILWANTED